MPNGLEGKVAPQVIQLECIFPLLNNSGKYINNMEVQNRDACKCMTYVGRITIISIWVHDLLIAFFQSFNTSVL